MPARSAASRGRSSGRSIRPDLYRLRAGEFVGLLLDGLEPNGRRRRETTAAARQRQDEVRAVAELGPDGQLAPVQARVAEGDRESEPGASDRPSAGRIRAPEAIEHVLDLSRS